MGERTEFRQGDKVPNSATYIEIGENDRIMGINDPKKVELEAGERFPETTNHNRKWSKMS